MGLGVLAGDSVWSWVAYQAQKTWLLSELIVQFKTALEKNYLAFLPSE